MELDQALLAEATDEVDLPLQFSKRNPVVCLTNSSQIVLVSFHNSVEASPFVFGIRENALKKKANK